MNSHKDSEHQEVDIIQTKNKRDQYVMEIRKHKVDEILKAKRLKLASSFYKNNSNKENNAQNKHFEQIGEDNEVIKTEEIPNFEVLTSDFFKAVQSNDVDLLLSVVIFIRKKLSQSETPPLQEFIETGLFPHLVKFLNDDYKSIQNLQYEVLWIISNSFSGTAEQSSKFMSDNLLKTLVKLIWDKRLEIVDTTFWALANITGDDDSIRLKLLDMGINEEIAKFLKVSSSFPGDLLKNVIWLVSNLALVRGKYEKFKPLFQMLPVFLSQNDVEICSKTCYIYSSLAQGDIEILDALFNDALLKRVVDLLDHVDVAVKVPAGRVIGNLLSSDTYTKKVVDAGCLPKLEGLMTHRRYYLRREVLWAISNIIADSPNMIAKVLQTNIFPKLFNSIIMDITQCKTEALLCLINAFIRCSTKQAEIIFGIGLPKILSAALGNDHPTVVLYGLECLEKLLEKGQIIQNEEDADQNPFIFDLNAEGTLAKLEQLQYHKNQEIYNKVSSIIDKFLEYQQE